MASTGRMRHLTTAQGSFHGRLLAARLGAEGVLVELRGLTDGPYPIQSPVEVYVGDDQLAFAREILLADAVDELFTDAAVSPELPGDDPCTLSCTPPGLRSCNPRGLHGAEQGLSSGLQARSRLSGLGAAVAILLVIALVLTGAVVIVLG